MRRRDGSGRGGFRGFPNQRDTIFLARSICKFSERLPCSLVPQPLLMKDKQGTTTIIFTDCGGKSASCASSVFLLNCVQRYPALRRGVEDSLGALKRSARSLRLVALRVLDIWSNCEAVRMAVSFSKFFVLRRSVPGLQIRCQ